jgi:hypothetical protein
MVYPPATSEAGARRPTIIQLEQFKEASSKPAQLKAFRLRPFLEIIFLEKFLEKNNFLEKFEKKIEI